MGNFRTSLCTEFTKWLSSDSLILASSILEPLYLRAAEEIGSEALSRAISASLERVLSCKDEFKSKPEYWLMFTMLVNDPFVLIKYVYSYRFSLDIKEFRCFLSYLIREDIFSQAPLLEFGKRLFQIVWTSISARRNLEALVEEARGQPLSMLNRPEYPFHDSDDNPEKKEAREDKEAKLVSLRIEELNDWLSERPNIDLIGLVDPQGNTLLHQLAFEDHLDIIKLFVKYVRSGRISLDEEDKLHSTALHWAAYMNSEQVTAYILSEDKLQTLNHRDEEGNTPLMLAVTYGNTRVVRRLLIKGADRYLRNN
ncbi:unnamed protein product [Sphagnum balticum]